MRSPRNNFHLLLRKRRGVRLTQPDEELRGFRGFVEHRELGGSIYVQRNFSTVVDDPCASCLFIKLGSHGLSCSPVTGTLCAGNPYRVQDMVTLRLLFAATHRAVPQRTRKVGSPQAATLPSRESGFVRCPE